jgi:DNA mismatch endonuclease (patch repair protein)
MPDQFDSKKRSEIMARVHSANTTPEKYVCGLLEDFGFSFFLHADDLPGRPDIVLPDFDIAIFVNGCFWHSCPLCNHAKITAVRFSTTKNKKLVFRSF